MLIVSHFRIMTPFRTDIYTQSILFECFSAKIFIDTWTKMENINNHKCESIQHFIKQSSTISGNLEEYCSALFLVLCSQPTPQQSKLFALEFYILIFILSVTKGLCSFYMDLNQIYLSNFCIFGRIK